jgi:hypothetical protein
MMYADSEFAVAHYWGSREANKKLGDLKRQLEVYWGLDLPLFHANQDSH